MTVDELLQEGRYSLYPPTSVADLTLDYPDLRSVDEFIAVRNNNPRKLLFVWHYACKTSKAMQLVDDIDRIRYAMFMAWDGKVPSEIEKDYLNRKFGEEVSKAIVRMRAYEPEPRIRMKLMAEKKFLEVQRMVDAPPAKVYDKDGKERDLDAEASIEHFKMISSGMKLLAELQPLTEQGALGVIREEDGEEKEGAAAERFFNRLKQKQA